MAEMMKGNEAIAEVWQSVPVHDSMQVIRLHHPVKLWNIYHGE